MVHKVAEGLDGSEVLAGAALSYDGSVVAWGEYWPQGGAGSRGAAAFAGSRREAGGDAAHTRLRGLLSSVAFLAFSLLSLAACSAAACFSFS